MPSAIHVPRINNNDDTVRLAVLSVEVGAFVSAGDTVIEVESEKAAVAVEADRDGYVLAVLGAEGDMLQVGAVALWLGETADEAVPETAQAAAPADQAGAGTATAKARLLLGQYGLAAADVPQSGDRLTASDVEAHVAARGLTPRVGATPTPAATAAPGAALPASATIRPAEPVRRGMVASVTWQRDHAAATYLEIPFDPAPWDARAAAFAKTHRLLFSPLLPLLAFRLVTLARRMPLANATVLERPDGIFEASYDTVNLGFTVQAGETLYLVVLAEAETLDEPGFVARLGDLQRRAIARKLQPAELHGATIGFSSMARWGVARHIPVLAPHTAVMVSHTVGSMNGRPSGSTVDGKPSGSTVDGKPSGSTVDGKPSGCTVDGKPAGVLGVTYDHRVLSGFDAVRLLRALAVPDGD